MHGSTATISAAFNGYPVPAIIWRRDGKMVASEGRFKITSCATSSVLEIIQLQYEDTGVYTCCLSNSMGSEDGSMMLTIQGESEFETWQQTHSCCSHVTVGLHSLPRPTIAASETLCFQGDQLICQAQMAHPRIRWRESDLVLPG